ncbi:MAG TPA: DUF6640 family protein [Streptosporangiaceae bacterium]|jgi:hypothetical protein
MRISRLILTGAAVGTIVGTGRADINSTHILNDEWTPHARFHNAAGWGTVTGTQLLALWLLWRPAQLAESPPVDSQPVDSPSVDRQPAAVRDLAVAMAALLPAVAWLPFFGALAVPGTAVEDEPEHLPRIAGVPVNLVAATVIPAISALGYALHRRGL